MGSTTQPKDYLLKLFKHLSSAKCSQLQFWKFIVVAVNHNLQQNKQSLESAILHATNMKRASFTHCASITAQLPDIPVKVEINNSSQVQGFHTAPTTAVCADKQLLWYKVNTSNDVRLICILNGLGGLTRKIYALSSNMPVPWNSRKHHECNKFGCSNRKCNISCAQVHKR